MPLEEPQTENFVKVNWAIFSSGAFLGAVLSFFVFSGDYQGRVNLLYLLLVYFFIPLVGIIFSLLGLIQGKGINFAMLWQKLPLSNISSSRQFRKIQQLRLEKSWLFLQSQSAALAYSVASLFVFFLMLLATDVNFIWRSTLLNVESLYAFLKTLSLPWEFWQSAQPNFQLLDLTQDSRLNQVVDQQVNYGNWWQFILAVQLFYCIIPRTFMLFIGRFWLKQQQQKDFASSLNTRDVGEKLTQNNEALAEIVTDVPSGFSVVNWAGADSAQLSEVLGFRLHKDNLLIAGPLATEAEQGIAERWQGCQLLVVKSWEPPLGELSDYMQNGSGFLLPLDWSNEGLTQLTEKHLNEWRRFVSQQDKWQLFLPKHLQPKKD